MREAGLSVENYISPEREQNPEILCEQITRKAQESRFALLAGDLFDKVDQYLPKTKAGQKSLNQIPYIGDAAMLIKSFTGREAGEKLTLQERAMYFAAGSTEIASLVLLFSGQLVEGGSAHIASGAFATGDAGIALVKGAAKLVSEKGVRGALGRMLEASAEWLEKQKLEKIPKIQEMINSSMSKLDLESYNPDGQQTGV